MVLGREFLTGFHKRKVAKKEEAKKKAKLREKLERLETRREVCLSCPLTTSENLNLIDSCGTSIGAP
jgi:ribosomal RNA-processing protein 17